MCNFNLRLGRKQDPGSDTCSILLWANSADSRCKGSWCKKRGVAEKRIHESQSTQNPHLYPFLPSTWISKRQDRHSITSQLGVCRISKLFPGSQGAGFGRKGLMFTHTLSLWACFIVLQHIGKRTASSPQGSQNEAKLSSQVPYCVHFIWVWSGVQLFIHHLPLDCGQIICFSLWFPLIPSVYSLPVTPF